MILMKCKCNGEIKYRKTTTYQHRTKRSVTFSQPVCNANQNKSAHKPDTNTTNFIYPVLINCIFYKKSNPQNKYCYTNFVDEIFPNKFFYIRAIAQPFLKPAFNRLINRCRLLCNYLSLFNS